MKQVIILESVGSCIDDDGNVYPLNCDGTPDLMITCHVEDMSLDDDWWNRISDEDAVLVYQVMRGEGKLNE
jgi:hypothetical protein